MKKKWWVRFSFLIIVAVVSVSMVIPTFFNTGKSFPVQSKINLGLDLQGGLYMILGIDFNKVYQEEIRNNASRVVFYLKDQGIKAELGTLSVDLPEDPRHSIILSDTAKSEEAREIVKRFFNGVVRLTEFQERTLSYGLHNAYKTDIEQQSVNKSIEVIRNRIDEFGVTEPEIVSQGNDRIIVQLPGAKDIERAKELIGRTAKLEFRLVNSDIALPQIQAWIEKAKEQGVEYKEGVTYSQYLKKLNQALVADLPKGTQLIFEKTVSSRTNETTNLIPYLVENFAKVSGDDLQDARVLIDPQKNEPYVSLDFKSAGATKFEEITGDNVGKQLAIVLDGNVYSAPQIQSRIGGGRAQINMGRGNFQQSMQDARDIALVLRAGALPVQLEFQEQRIVGPQLGADSILAAEKASLYGSILVFLFILFYYRTSGALALTTLVLNIVIVLAALVAFKATLTLPGIAGIALTIGMAIDASIIIYERIREEVHKGVSNFKAVENGFSTAFWTILDANITTALAGFCLLNFGTGPIRGFAVTLLIGIAATVYSAYFVGSLLFELYMSKVKGQKLSI